MSIASPSQWLRPANDELMVQLARFPRAVRKSVRRTALAHPRLADLAFTYPLALHAIACRSAGRCRTKSASDMAAAGARLRDIAHILCLPMWLRRMPPEGVREIVPVMPTDAAFNCQIANWAPKKHNDLADWAAAVSVAANAHTRGFALWLARDVMTWKAVVSVQCIELMAAYAWFSTHPAYVAGRAVPRRWRNTMSIPEAVSATSEWLTALEYLVLVPPTRLRVSPPGNAIVNGFEFVRFGWGEEAIREARALQNCLISYADCLFQGSEVWLVRRDGQTVAAMELEFRNKQHGIPRLSQLLARANDPADDAIWQAAYQWLGNWAAQSTAIIVKEQHEVCNAEAWHRVWSPLWKEKGEGRLVPLHVSNGANQVSALRQELDAYRWMNKRT